MLKILENLLIDLLNMIKQLIKLHLHRLWWWQRGRVRRYLLECLELIQNDPNDVERVKQIIYKLNGKQREVLVLCLRDSLNYVVTVGNHLISAELN